MTLSAPLLLLVIALGLIGVVYEFCAPGWIWPGALGGLLATVGLYHAITTGFHFWQSWTLCIGIPTAVVLIFLIFTAVRADKNKQFAGDDSYIGELGITLTSVHENTGSVRVRNQDFNATSDVAIPAGKEIIVRRKTQNLLTVTPR
ncbi:hypothetical protein F183_A35200 [Bryobacterales bacterium F-183]|nr:hypothetical protein F183_A35200 [Bryobacterales bacterium F-183]